MKLDTIEKEMSLLEFLMRTNYMTQISEPEDKTCEKYVGFGSGFIVSYKEHYFFITADHTVNFDDDHNNRQSNRSHKNYIVSIFNNVSHPENTLTTLLTPLGGFYYFDKLTLSDFDKNNINVELVDVALCILKEKQFENPFFIDEDISQRKDFNQRKNKVIISEQTFGEASEEQTYYIYGTIKAKINGIRLDREKTLKKELIYKGKSGDYYLLNTDNPIDYNEWAGLSGSPVISNEGKCIGVVCSVLPDSKSIFIAPMNDVKRFMDYALLNENECRK
jgi:hypothetical protein